MTLHRELSRLAQKGRKQLPVSRERSESHGLPRLSRHHLHGPRLAFPLNLHPRAPVVKPMRSRASDEVEHHRRAPVLPLLESGLDAQLVASCPRNRAGEYGSGGLSLELGLMGHPGEEPVVRFVFVTYFERDEHSATQSGRTED